ncbi:MAG: hypothetical protein U0411_10620 [Thermodesulfovibrionales bacterium]
MARREKESSGPDKGPVKKEVPAEREAGESGGDECRCKEVAGKSLPGLLKLMMHDLAFWKKAGGPKGG